MAFGVGKLPGLNGSHKKQLARLADRGCTPQEISDRIDVNLKTVLCFYQLHTKKSDEEMAEYTTADTSIASDREAMERAEEIIAAAEAKAASITAEAVKESNGKTKKGD